MAFCTKHLARLSHGSIDSHVFLYAFCLIPTSRGEVTIGHLAIDAALDRTLWAAAQITTPLAGPQSISCGFRILLKMPHQ